MIWVNSIYRISLTVILYIIAEFTSMMLVLTTLKAHKNGSIVIQSSSIGASHDATMTKFQASTDEPFVKSNIISQ